MSNYSAKQGDVIWLNFDPRVGHEQAGKRPAVIVSNDSANSVLNNRAMVCPITNTNRGYPFQPPLDERTKTKGVVLCDQARFVDLAERNPEYIEQLPQDILEDVVDIIYGMIEIL